MKTKFRLLKKQIKAGKRQDSLACPLALCLNAATGRLMNVGPGCIWSEDGLFPKLCVITPKKLRRFIERFDAGKPVKPFKFTLKLK